MPLDATAIRAVTREIKEEILNARVEKLYQPEQDEIMMVFKSQSGVKKLVVSANSQNPRIHLTGFSKENPKDAPMFCMLLRKHLSSGKVTDVRQIDFERITDIEFEARNELGDAVTKHLICEIMGKNSNIILTDDKLKIIDSIKRVDITMSRARNIFPGLTYRLPPSSDRENPLLMTKEDFCEAISNSPEGKNLDSALPALIGGLSPLMAREAAYRAVGAPSLKVGEIGEEERRSVAGELFKLFQTVKDGEFSPCVVYKDGEARPTDFAAVDIKQYGSSYRTVKKESMCLAMEDYYRERDLAERMRTRSYTLTKAVTLREERLRKKLVILRNTLRDAGERDKYRMYGDIITANLYRMKQGDKSLRAVNFYDDAQGEIEIRLDESKSPSQNAQSCYKKYSKAKTAETEAAKQIELAEEELKYLESVLNEIERAKSPSELEEIASEIHGDEGNAPRRGKKPPKKRKLSAPEEYEYMDYEIFSGKNNLQNDYLTMKMSRSGDLWLHTKNIPGSHVIVKYRGEEFPSSVIEAAAIVAATNSKGVNSPKVDVDYCPVSHVRKPNGARAGMVVYEGYKTASVVPDRAFCDKIKKNKI